MPKAIVKDKATGETSVVEQAKVNRDTHDLIHNVPPDAEISIEQADTNGDHYVITLPSGQKTTLSPVVVAQ